MEPKEFLTAHDVISAGACRGGVLEWCIKKCFFLGTTKEALALASGTDAEHIEKAAGLRGFGDGFGFGDGDGFGDGFGDGDGNGFGNGDGDGNGGI